MSANRKFGAILKEVITIDLPKVLANPIASILSNISIYDNLLELFYAGAGILL